MTPLRLAALSLGIAVVLGVAAILVSPLPTHQKLIVLAAVAVTVAVISALVDL